MISLGLGLLDILAVVAVGGGVVLIGIGLRRYRQLRAIDRRAVETAMERLEADTEWSFNLDGTETPSTWSVVRDAPKRGPTRMAARYALQSIKDKLRLSPK